MKGVDRGVARRRRALRRARGRRARRRGGIRDRGEHRAPARAPAHDRGARRLGGGRRRAARLRADRGCGRLRLPRGVRRRRRVSQLRARPRDEPQRPPRRRGRREVLRAGADPPARLDDHGHRHERGRRGRLAARRRAAVRHPLATATAIAFAGSRSAPRERAFIGWFGVRGIGSLYYVAVALGSGILSVDESRSLFWTVAACVVASIVLHGVTAAPLSRRLLPQPRP